MKKLFLPILLLLFVGDTASAHFGLLFGPGNLTAKIAFGIILIVTIFGAAYLSKKNK